MNNGTTTFFFYAFHVNKHNDNVSAEWSRNILYVLKRFQENTFKFTTNSRHLFFGEKGRNRARLGTTPGLVLEKNAVFEY